MPDQIDLDPNEYGEKGRNEPIFAKRWWIGILAIAIIFAIGFAKFGLMNWLTGH